MKTVVMKRAAFIGVRGSFSFIGYQATCARRGFTVNLHAPGCGGTATYESLAGTFGISEFMSPIRRRDFYCNPIPYS